MYHLGDYLLQYDVPRRIADVICNHADVGIERVVLRHRPHDRERCVRVVAHSVVTDCRVDRGKQVNSRGSLDGKRKHRPQTKKTEKKKNTSRGDIEDK